MSLITKTRRSAPSREGTLCFSAKLAGPRPKIRKKGPVFMLFFFAFSTIFNRNVTFFAILMMSLPQQKVIKVIFALAVREHVVARTSACFVLRRINNRRRPCLLSGKRQSERKAINSSYGTSPNVPKPFFSADFATDALGERERNPQCTCRRNCVCGLERLFTVTFHSGRS